MVARSRMVTVKAKSDCLWVILCKEWEELDNKLDVRFEREKLRWQQGFKPEYLGKMVYTIY